MTVYATQFNVKDLKNPYISVDSGFTSLLQVVKTMGKPDQPVQSPGILIYGNSDDRVMFSNVKFRK